MRRSRLFAMALGLAALMAVAATAITITRQGRTGLPVEELLRVKTVRAGDGTEAGEQLRFLAEVLDGSRQLTESDLTTRFSPDMAAEGLTAEFLNATVGEELVRHGPIRYVRVADQGSDFVRVLSVADDGTPYDVYVFPSIDGRIAWFELPEAEGSPRRLPAWDWALTLLAGWGLLAAAAMAWRYRAAWTAWSALAAAISALAAVAVLSESSAGYTVGRAGVAIAVVPATALLVAPAAQWARVVAVGLAGGAGLVGAIAPLTRDSSLIGHPAVLGSITDDLSTYRTLLTAAAALTFMALAFTAAIVAGSPARTAQRVRQVRWMAAAVAAIWSAGALGSAIDLATGDAGLAGGPFRAMTGAALLAVPAVVILRLNVSRWEQPELAALIIDLESEGVDLQAAVSRALDDPTLQVLTDEDDRLLDSAGREVSPSTLPEGLALTRIRSGDRSIGALLHRRGLQRDPDRLRAVAAAAGKALEVSLLNRQVLDQLAEVNASRARILEASDTARRRVERDLHDGAQQRLVAHGLNLQRARRIASAEHLDDLAALLDDASRDVREAIDDIRAVARGAQPALLAERGLASAVDALAERAPIPVSIDVAAQDLPDDTEHTAFYVIAEGLTNVAKHARATEAKVEVDRVGGQARITIRDNGVGGARIAPGSGLEGLSDRVAAIGGTLEVFSDNGGTTLQASIPCEKTVPCG